MFLEYVSRYISRILALSSSASASNNNRKNTNDNNNKPSTSTVATETEASHINPGTPPPPNYPVVYNSLETGWTVEREDNGTEGLKSYENHELCPIVLGDVLSGCNIINCTNNKKNNDEDGVVDESDGSVQKEKSEDCPEHNRVRFEVVQKLGHGAFATVWLARDLNHPYLSAPRSRSSSLASTSAKSSSSLSLASMLTANPIAQSLMPSSAIARRSSPARASSSSPPPPSLPAPTASASSSLAARLWPVRRGRDQQQSLRAYIEGNRKEKLGHRHTETRPNYVAVKVLRLTASEPSNSEMKTLQKLGKLQCAFFHTNSRSGLKYLCLVTDPMGRTLDIRIPLVSHCTREVQCMTALIKALVEKVFDLHEKGFTHGDLSDKNVVLGLSRKALRKGHIKKSFSSTYRIHVIFNEGANPPRLRNAAASNESSGGGASSSHHAPPPPLPPSLPKYLIASHAGQPAFLESDLKDMSKIDIIDFGSSFEDEIQDKQQLGATFSYTAPELQARSIASASRESDLWGLGILIMRGLTDQHIFFCNYIREKYMTGTISEQLGVIDSFLSCNTTLSMRQNRDYRFAVGDLVHTLLRTNPRKRNPRKVLEYLREIEDLTPDESASTATKGDGHHHHHHHHRRRAKKKRRFFKVLRAVRRQWRPALRRMYRPLLNKLRRKRSRK